MNYWRTRECWVMFIPVTHWAVFSNVKDSQLLITIFHKMKDHLCKDHSIYVILKSSSLLRLEALIKDSNVNMILLAKCIQYLYEPRLHG